nr:hypothetical protein [Bacilli bacterium]
MFTLTTLISTLFLSIGVAYNAPKTNNYQHDDNIESPSMCADPSESDISHTNTFHFNDSNINQSGEYKNVGVETFELKYSDEKYENNTIRAAGYLYWKDDSNNN